MKFRCYQFSQGLWLFYLFSLFNCQNRTAHNSHIENKEMTMPYSIKAQVVDKQKQPIVEAMISVAKGPEAFLQIVLLTDKEGRFLITPVTKTGEYTINVQYRGKEKDFIIEVPQKDSVKTLIWE